MKRFLFIYLVLVHLVFNLHAESKVVDESLNNLLVQENPWVTVPATLYQMTVYAQVKKNGVLFQPNGLLLGVFKDNINNQCWGWKGLTNGPGGILLHNLSMAYNSTPASGFTFKVYDPNTLKVYSVVETINFAANTPVGKINIPIICNINSEIVTSLNPIEISQMSISPNPIESNFNIIFNTASASASYANIAIYSLDGLLVKTLYNGTLNGQYKISIQRDNSIQKGLYILKASVDDRHYSQKLIFK